ncbi:putative ATP-grasp-modified RiPP [Streptomyces iconiensis]|uniref:ATP-grasp-modified RiPP n=1 Tax=Streptomyces iconiensis TaxID=1384038 RepID=A0ABT6ZQA1_9ACTN|nr:putative ATP-grasp-modified RiPP [Streptomyces iconiensis]MDJ1131230.1 putative ATP-grasp-modified RiPP [Streptomyces iconiensis]
MFATLEVPTQHPTQHLMPFGLTRALPVEPPATRIWPGELAYCPEQQLTIVIETGETFVDSPSMGSTVQTVTQTKEDNQTWDDDGGTDKD